MSPVTNFNKQSRICNGVRAIFVTAIDTGAGKTIVSGLLGRYLLNRGYRVITQKWVQSGSNGFSQDIDLHLRLMGKKRQDIKYYLTHVSPYTFKFPSSPHLAASLEKRTIDTNKIKRGFKYLQKRFDFVIVEGIGGVLVPLNKKRLVIDIAKELNLPVLIVAGNKLGAINHTLLTVEALRRRKMNIVGIIFNNRYKKVDRIILKDNVQIIKKITGEKILGILPWENNKESLYKAFISIGRKIVSDEPRYKIYKRLKLLF